MALKVKELEAAFKKASAHWPEAEVARNAMGNLAFRDNDEYVGYLDILTGDVYDATTDEMVE